MCREGIDLVTLKVAIKHSAERLEREMDQLKQWSALAANVSLEDVSSQLSQAVEKLAGGEELLAAGVQTLAELQVHGTGSGLTAPTITPM
jgi:paraquat-inducible protein B